MTSMSRGHCIQEFRSPGGVLTCDVPGCNAVASDTQPGDIVYALNLRAWDLAPGGEAEAREAYTQLSVAMDFLTAINAKITADGLPPVDIVAFYQERRDNVNCVLTICQTCLRNQIEALKNVG